MVQFIFPLSNVSVFDEAHLWQSVTFLASMGYFPSVNIVPLHSYVNLITFIYIYKTFSKIVFIFFSLKESFRDTIWN